MSTAFVEDVATEALVRVGGSVLLRPHRPDDLPALTRIWQDPRVMNHMAEPAMTRREAAEAFGRLLDLDRYIRRSYRFAIVRRADDAVVGTFGFDQERFCSGYSHSLVMHPDTWGTGLAHEAYHLLLAFGFDELGVHRVWTACAVENERASRFILSVGFTSFGVIRHYYQKNGEWGDCISFNYLVDEWKIHQEVCAKHLHP